MPLFLLFFTLASLPAQATTQKNIQKIQNVQKTEFVDRIVARVNTSIITQSDLEQALKKNSQFNKEAILQKLIDDKLMEEELKDVKYQVTDDEVVDALQKIAAQNGTNIDGLRIKITETGESFEDYKDNLKKDLRKNKFMKDVIYPRLKINDDDLAIYYAKHQNQYISYKKVRFLEIFITPDSVPAGKNITDFAKSLITQLKGGASWQTLANLYSKGAFASNGGDSGLLDTHEMRADLLGLLLHLSLNKISEPVPTPNGIFIFKVTAKTDSYTPPLEEVKERIRQDVADERVSTELKRYLIEVRSRAFIDLKE